MPHALFAAAAFLVLRYAPFGSDPRTRALFIVLALLLPAFAGPAAGSSYLSLRVIDAAAGSAPLLQAALFTTFLSGPVLLSGRFWLRPRMRMQDAWLLLRGLCKLLLLLPLVMHFESGLLLPLRLNADGFTNALRTGLFFYARIFLDFSGYSDCITGLCGLLGIRVRNNFCRPYYAASLRAFWLRWHATLGDVLRRHLYPVLPKPAGAAIVLLVVGAWHGISAHTLIWGGLHGAALLLEKRVLYPFGQRLKNRFGVLTARVYGTVLTQTFVTFSWILFFWK